MKMIRTFFLLASLLVSGAIHAGSFKLDDAALAQVNDFASGAKVIAKVIAVADTSITVRSLSTGYEKKLGGKLSRDMLGKCVSVVKLSESKFDVNPSPCKLSHDGKAKAELKQQLDAAAKAK
ncbi:MAG: hypothetical protein HY847_17275 [Betaproteobacteria bacterium]|nr:hypothetical protein [Betaproteobacteria bacterium]